MGSETTAEEIAEIKDHNRIADGKINDAVSRQRRHKKNEVALKDQRAELMRQVRELDDQIWEERANVREAQQDAYEASKGRLFLPHDAEPELVQDVSEWSRHLRRRAWTTAFAASPVSRLFTGPTGTRDLMLFLTLCFLAERQNTQVVEADIPAMVRVAAMDNKTVVAGLKSLRSADLLLWVGTARHSPVGNPLLPISEASEPPASGIGTRFWGGDREHDAFGGRFGIKAIWIRAWIWLYLNPGATRAEVAKYAGPKGQSAYRAIDDMMEKAHLVRMGDDGKCFVIEPQKSPKRWLDEYVDRRGLFGAVANRVERAVCPSYVLERKRARRRGAHEVQAAAVAQESSIRAERRAEIAAKYDMSDLVDFFN